MFGGGGLDDVRIEEGGGERDRNGGGGGWRRGWWEGEGGGGGWKRIRTGGAGGGECACGGHFDGLGRGNAGAPDGRGGNKAGGSSHFFDMCGCCLPTTSTCSCRRWRCKRCT